MPLLLSSRSQLDLHAVERDLDARRRSQAARSGEFSSRIGFVLLMWISTLRVLFGRRASQLNMPSSPLCARWPICEPRLAEMPSATISSSVQKVPSTITTSAVDIASHTAGSMRSSPGA